MPDPGNIGVLSIDDHPLRREWVMKQGQLLFQLDPWSFQAAVDQARGQLKQTERQLEKSRAQVAVADASGPLSGAWFGAKSSSMWRSAASTTTIASSTTGLWLDVIDHLVGAGVGAFNFRGRRGRRGAGASQGARACQFHPWTERPGDDCESDRRRHRQISGRVPMSCSHGKSDIMVYSRRQD